MSVEESGCFRVKFAYISIYVSFVFKRPIFFFWHLLRTKDQKYKRYKLLQYIRCTLLGLKIKVSDNPIVIPTTHFQLKNTFQSHALRKFILCRLNINSNINFSYSSLSILEDNKSSNYQKQLLKYW